MGRLDQKVALVTGASAGIGRAAAIELARQGARVVLGARRKERLDAVVAEIEAAGGEALAVVCDVDDDDSVAAAAASGVERFGGFDVVLANAGFGVAGPLRKLTLDDYRRQFETNVFGVLRTVLATRDSLIERRGRLAIVGSVNSYLALPAGSAYAMSKHAVRALSESLHHELAGDGVSVTHVAPGFVQSDIRRVDNRGKLREDKSDPIPSWLMMATDKAARQIVRAIERRQREVIITGHGRFAVGMARHLPGVTSWIVGRAGIGPARPK